MEWIAHCTVCGEISRGPNGEWEESEARVHRRDTGHMTIVGYEPSIVMGEKMVEIDVSKRPSRPFPQTYGDWVGLAEDVKTQDPDNAVDVNNALTYISREDEAPHEANEAKRWLMRRARELDIK